MHAARGGMEGKFRKGCQKLAEEGGLARQLLKQLSSPSPLCRILQQKPKPEYSMQAVPLSVYLVSGFVESECFCAKDGGRQR